MTIGLIGQKIGMTRIFTENGVSTTVTIIKVKPNHISQLKISEIDGYNAIQVTVGKNKLSRVSRSQVGHKVCEFIVNSVNEYKVGSKLDVNIFNVGQVIDISGVSKGKGFAGVMKRYNFRGGDATHGNSISHRSLGSIGQCQTPGRVFKNKKMAGHMGNVKCTLQNLSVVRIDIEENLLFVKGSVPGSRGNNVIIKPAVKSE